MNRFIQEPQIDWQHEMRQEWKRLLVEHGRVPDLLVLSADFYRSILTELTGLFTNVDYPNPENLTIKVWNGVPILISHLVEKGYAFVYNPKKISHSL